ncbi:MAG: GldG family protein [Flavobacteriales bacterium]|nr:GldG family protein [Flavobacteriales bacterium]
MRTRRDLIRYTLLLVLALVLVNLVGSAFKFRWDLTSDKRYTLSPATLELLETLNEAVTITAYFSKDLPPDLELTRQDFHDLLVEYADRSDGNVVFEFIDPGADEKLEEEAVKAGIRPMLVNVREKDKQQQMKAYMGALVKMGEQVAPIAVIQPRSAYEWTLSSAIKQVSVVNKPTIGLVQGHGEPAMGALPQALQGLNVLYNVEHFTFWDTLPVHDRWEALVFIDPVDSIPPSHLYWLDDFLARGRSVVIAYSAIRSDLQQLPMAEARNTDLVQWLARKGLQVRPEVVIDAQCGQVNVLQQRGYFTMQTAIPFPYFPLVSRDGFTEHPVAGGLEAVLFQFSSPMEYTGDTMQVKYSPVLRTSAKSARLRTPAFIDLQRAQPWTDADFPDGPQVIGAALEGPLVPGGRPARLVVFTNGSFPVNGQGQQLQQVNPDNVNLLVNAVDWIADRTGLIDLRGKGVNYRPIRELGDAERTSLKWLNLLLPIGLALGYGLLRAQWRRRQRKQRMKPGHVQ